MLGRGLVRSLVGRRFPEPSRRFLSQASGPSSSGGGAEAESGAESGAPTEAGLTSSLRARFGPDAHISVEDISGGCGAMFDVNVESSEFAGLGLVKAHRRVSDALKEDIRDMHGIRIHTKAP